MSDGKISRRDALKAGLTAGTSLLAGCHTSLGGSQEEETVTDQPEAAPTRTATSTPTTEPTPSPTPTPVQETETKVKEEIGLDATIEEVDQWLDENYEVYGEDGTRISSFTSEEENTIAVEVEYADLLSVQGKEPRKVDMYWAFMTQDGSIPSQGVYLGEDVFGTMAMTEIGWDIGEPLSRAFTTVMGELSPYSSLASSEAEGTGWDYLRWEIAGEDETALSFRYSAGEATQVFGEVQEIEPAELAGAYIVQERVEEGTGVAAPTARYDNRLYISEGATGEAELDGQKVRITTENVESSGGKGIVDATVGESGKKQEEFYEIGTEFHFDGGTVRLNDVNPIAPYDTAAEWEVIPS